MIGNYGTGPADDESGRAWPGAVVMARAGDRPGAAGPVGWRAWLRERGVVAVEGCDTRRLVRHLRDRGAMRGGVSDRLGPDELLARVRAHPVLDGRDLASEAARAPRALGDDGPRVVAIDCGMKESIARGLVAAGCRLDVVPAGTVGGEVLARDPDGVVRLERAGRPGGRRTGHRGRARPARPGAGVRHLPRPSDARPRPRPTTRKLPSGTTAPTTRCARSDDGRREITVQNHGYAVEAGGLPDGVQVTRTSLFDGSVEGIAAPELRAWSVQYHPEASPGPRDASYMFRDFAEAISYAAPRPTSPDILVLGSGPIVIGQAGEFDYSGTQACRALRAEGTASCSSTRTRPRS